MICVNCGSENVTVTMQNDVLKTKTRGNGFLGNLNNFLRLITAICTLGISNIFWKKSSGNSKTKAVTKKVCLCQSCGHSWEIK